jgi:hypothetical protein
MGSQTNDRGERRQLTKVRVVAIALACALCAGDVRATTLDDPSSWEARLCRSILAVMNPPDSSFTVLTSTVLGRDETLFLNYRVREPDDSVHNGTLTCTFAHSEEPYAARELTEVQLDGTPLAEARLALLKRYWLRSSEALMAAARISLGFQP